MKKEKKEIQDEFENAIKQNDVEIVKLLLQDKRVDPSALNNYAIRYASGYGHHEVVKLLKKYKSNEKEKEIETLKRELRDLKEKYEILCLKLIK